jgi:hypothetical protein
MFKVGDIVTIRKDLIIEKSYGSYMFVWSMREGLGKKLKIKSIDYEGYNLEGFSTSIVWTSEMFEEGYTPKRLKEVKYL